MPRRPEIVTLVLVVMAVSCRPLPVSLSENPQSFASRDYERIFERWTRSTEAYNLDSLENALTVSATYRSWEFRQAWVQRYADDYRLEPEQIDELLEAQRIDYETSHEFVVSATAAKAKWADFTRDDTLWKLALVNDTGAEVAPLSVVKVDPDAKMLTYYPYINVFRKTFIISFPRTADEDTAILDPEIESFSMLFTGALGRAELTWKVAHD